MKILFLPQHLSTGGMPEFLRMRIELLQKYTSADIYVVEYSLYSGDFIVQRQEIERLVGPEKFFSLGYFSSDERVLEEKFLTLKKIILDNNFDIIHLDQVAEQFDSFNKISTKLLDFLYDDQRTWSVVETPHSTAFNSSEIKKYTPDGLLYCSDFHNSSALHDLNKKVVNKVIEYPLVPRESWDKVNPYNFKNPSVKNIVNIGLWNSNKNQGQAVAIARSLNEKFPAKYHFHFIGNQASNFEDYWSPLIKNLPTNVTIWGERNDVGKFIKHCDALIHTSLLELNPLVLKEAKSYGKKIILNHLDVYKQAYNYNSLYLTGDIDKDVRGIVDFLNHRNITKPLNPVVYGYNFALQHIRFYRKVEKDTRNEQKVFIQDSFKLDQTQGIKIFNTGVRPIDVSFVDKTLNQNIYSANLGKDFWATPNKKYFVDWKVVVKLQEETFEWNQNLEDKTVVILFESSSLGDTLAWIPYVEEFRKKHKCKIYCKTFFNSLFEKTYKDITFIDRNLASWEYNFVHAVYKVGIFLTDENVVDFNMHPNSPFEVPLQQVASDILGLSYRELKPKLLVPKVTKKEKLVLIGMQSTAQAKYWNYPNGWEIVVDFLNKEGYKVAFIDKHASFGVSSKFNTIPTNALDWTGNTNLSERISQLSKASLFIGLGSGLSWLSWAVGTPTVIISGFSEPYSEMTECLRITTPKGYCTGCFNREILDRSDWMWCPDHKGTERQFECTKAITPELVISNIKKFLQNENLD